MTIKIFLKQIWILTLIVCFFSGCSKSGDVNIDFSDLKDVNYNNYSILNKIDIKDNTLAVVQRHIGYEELKIYNANSKSASISSKEITQCQIDKQDVYYIEDDILYSYNKKTTEIEMVLENIHSFVVLNNSIVCYTFDCEIKFLDNDYNVVFSISDAFVSAVTEDAVYYTDVNRVLYVVSVINFEIEELATFDVDVHSCDMNVIGNKLVIEQHKYFLIYDILQAQITKISLSLPSATEAGVDYSIRNFICNDNYIYYTLYALKYHGSFSWAVNSDLNGVYSIDLNTMEEKKLRLIYIHNYTHLKIC